MTVEGLREFIVLQVHSKCLDLAPLRVRKQRGLQKKKGCSRKGTYVFSSVGGVTLITNFNQQFYGNTTTCTNRSSRLFFAYGFILCLAQPFSKQLYVDVVYSLCQCYRHRELLAMGLLVIQITVIRTDLNFLQRILAIGTLSSQLLSRAFRCIKTDFEFLLFQGSSKANVHMEWDKIWALNKKV